MAYERNPRKRIVRGNSPDELRSAGRRRSEELSPDGFDMPFVRLGNSVIGTAQDVVQRVGDAIIGGDFGGNARGSGAIDIQIERMVDNLSSTPDAGKVASGDGSILFGRSGRAAGFQAVAIGVGAIADGDYSTALGRGSALGDNSIAIGGSAGLSAEGGVAIGSQANVSGYGGIAIGLIAEAAADAIAIGEQEVYALGVRSIAVGLEARADGDDSIAIGYAAGYNQPASAGDRSIAIGRAAWAASSDQAVIAATEIKMQTASSPYTYESIITTADTPTAGNLAIWTDSDGIEDAGVAVGWLANDRYIGSSESRTVADRYSLVVSGYMEVDGALSLDGDAVLEIL